MMKTGRPKRDIDKDEFSRCREEVKEKRITADEAARQLNISRSTYFRRLKDCETN